MFTASVLAKMTNIPVPTVRYYTRLGLLTPVRDSRNRYKMYSNNDKERLEFISSAKSLGFTLAEIEQILDQSKTGDSPCPMVRKIVEQRIKDNRETIKQMQLMQRRLENALRGWEKMEDSQPDGHSVCRLIETFTDK